MGSKIWRFELDHWEQVVEIEYGFLSGVNNILVNGSPVEKDKKNNFRIRDHTCKIDILDSLFSSEYNLLIDGRLVGGGQEVRAPRSKSIPGWAWLFVAAYLAIPIVALGGCIPGAIGGGGAAGRSGSQGSGYPYCSCGCIVCSHHSDQLDPVCRLRLEVCDRHAF
jgi:hypothetical protein